MNHLLEDLAKFCSNCLLDEKVLVAPSLAAGHQIVESLPRFGHPWVNLRVETVMTLAAKLVGPYLARDEKRTLSRAQSLALVEQACLQELRPDSYYGQLRDRPGFHRAVQKTLADLRVSNIPAQAIEPGLLETEQKAAELRAIAQTYTQMLVDGGFVDSTDVLHLALAKTQQQSRSDAAWYLVPEGLDASGVEREFLEALAGKSLVTLKTDSPDNWFSSLESVEITRALGEENEVRELFRQILRERLPLDSVEIIYTDSGTYIPLIYEMSSQYELSCTFAQGIPVAFTRPGQAAIAFLEWLGSGCDANVLRRKIADGCLDFGSVTQSGDPPGALAAARIIREAGIGWGRDRHLPCIDNLLDRYERRIGHIADDEEYGNVSEAAREKHKTALIIRRFVIQLLELSSAACSNAVDYTRLAAGLSGFISQFAGVGSEIDGVAKNALVSMFAEFMELPSAEMSLTQAVCRLQEAVVGTYVNASRPTPGCLHAAPYNSGGYSGRGRVFLVGLDESRHPGKETQDPVLLDSERQKINQACVEAQLPLMASVPMENAAAMRACLARLRANVTLSFSCRSLLDDREQFPSSLVLEAYRLLNSVPDADYTHMLDHLNPPSGFVAPDGEHLDDTEWWLGAIRKAGDAQQVRSAVMSAYPWLDDGRIAESERDSNRFTIYDGRIDLDAPELAPCTDGVCFSATRLESLAKCPFAYFTRNILGINPVDDRVFDATRWLDPLEYGTMLHEVLKIFMERITVRGERPKAAEHSRELESIALSMIEDYRNDVPPPNNAAFKAQRDEILRTCSIFLRVEEQHCRNSEPVFFEVPFGYREAESGSRIASKDPVRIDLGNGGSFLFTGKIDRIDQTPGGDWEVWDYKSGSARAYKEESFFNGGRQLQHALYAAAADQLLARAGYKGHVVRSGYFFPSIRAEGSRIVREPNHPRMQALLSDLFDLLKTGSFVPSCNAGDCRYCDYKVCCGGTVAPERSMFKVAWPENVVLEPMRRLAENG